MFNGGVCEEAVVEERAFQDEVSQGIEGMPDEKEAEFGGC